jgi:hypothetical protein
MDSPCSASPQTHPPRGRFTHFWPRTCSCSYGISTSSSSSSSQLSQPQTRPARCRKRETIHASVLPAVLLQLAHPPHSSTNFHSSCSYPSFDRFSTLDSAAVVRAVVQGWRGWRDELLYHHYYHCLRVDLVPRFVRVRRASRCGWC